MRRKFYREQTHQVIIDGVQYQLTSPTSRDVLRILRETLSSIRSEDQSIVAARDMALKNSNIPKGVIDSLSLDQLLEITKMIVGV